MTNYLWSSYNKNLINKLQDPLNQNYDSMLILIALFLFVQSAVNKCGKTNTELYDTMKGHESDYIQFNTFFGQQNKCLDLGYTYRNKYIALLESNGINCTGNYCAYGGFDCQKRPCYEVEHIVDLTNTPYQNCNPNILGNVIMAYDKWNRQVGQMCWKDVESEKMAVYGKKIFCEAVRNVVECGKCNVPLPHECIEYTNRNIVIAVSILGTVVAVIAIISLVLFGENIAQKCCGKKDPFDDYSTY